MLKTLWRLSREAIRYRTLYIIAILSTFALTLVNLAAPRVLSYMTGLVEKGIDDAGLRSIAILTAILAGLYLLRIRSSEETERPHLRRDRLSGPDDTEPAR